MGPLLAKYTTAEKQMQNGWQGRARMSVGIPLRVRVAEAAYLDVPKWVVDAAEERIAKANAEGSKWAFYDEREADDDMVSFRAPTEWVNPIFAKQKAKEAE
jgi:hypothetical protein